MSTPAELTIDTVQEPAAEIMPLALAHQQQEADETYGSMLTPAVTTEDIHLDAIAKLSTRVSLKLHHWRAAAHKQKTHARLLEDQLWRAETSEQNLAEELDNLRQKTNEGSLQLQHWQAVAYQQGVKLRDTEAHGQRIQNKLQHCIYAVQHLKARHRIEALIQNTTGELKSLRQQVSDQSFQLQQCEADQLQDTQEELHSLRQQVNDRSLQLEQCQADKLQDTRTYETHIRNMAHQLHSLHQHRDWSDWSIVCLSCLLLFLLPSCSWILYDTYYQCNYQWEYLEREPDRWVRYTAEAESLLEAAHRRGQTTLEITSFKYRYTICLRAKTQTNSTTSKIRHVRRIRVAGKVSLWREMGQLHAEKTKLESAVESYQAQVASASHLHQQELAAIREQSNAATSGLQSEMSRMVAMHSNELKKTIALHKTKQAEQNDKVVSLQRELASTTAVLREVEAGKALISAEKAALQKAVEQLQHNRCHYHRVLLSQFPLLPPHAPVEARELPWDDPKCTALVEMFHGSLVRHRLNYNSNQWCEKPKVVVTRVCEVHNAKKQQAYENARGFASDQCVFRCTPIQGVSALKCEVPCAGKDLNEYLLYHGTSFQRSQAIIRLGLDAQRGGDMTGAMFGKGTYFAQNASKSDLYTTCDCCLTDSFRDCRHAQGERCVLVARVLLGETHVEKAPTADTRQWIRAPDKPDGTPHDSVTGECKADGGAVDHKEFVIFKDDRMHVQFQIFYRHDVSCTCNNCLYRKQ